MKVDEWKDIKVERVMEIFVKKHTAPSYVTDKTCILFLQVREQQKYISLQIRQRVKQRRAEKLHQLEEALRAEWQKAQEEKMKALEKLFLSSLRAVGEGHRQAKENVSKQLNVIVIEILDVLEVLRLSVSWLVYCFVCVCFNIPHLGVIISEE